MKLYVGAKSSETLINLVIGVALFISVAILALWGYEHFGTHHDKGMDTGFFLLEGLVLLLTILAVLALIQIRKNARANSTFSTALEHAANLSGVGYLHFFPSSKIWVANRVAQALLRRPTSQFTASVEDLLHRVHPNDLDSAREAAAAALRSNDPISGNLRLGSEEEGYTQIRYQAYRLKDGSLSITLVDIEEELQLRRLSELNEIRLQGALSAANAARLSFDRKTGVLLLPQLASLMLELEAGSDIEDLIALIDTAYQDDFRSRIRKDDEFIEAFENLYPIRLAGGEERWMKFTVSNEGSSQVNITLVDLTELKLTEFQQRLLIQQLEFASGLAGLSIFEECLESGHVKSLVQSPDQDFEFPDGNHLLLHVPARYHSDIRTAQREIGTAVEFPFTDDMGQVHWLKYSVISIYERGGKDHRLVIVQDIDQIVNQRDSLLETLSEMELAQKDLQLRTERERQMFAVIGHELRTPAANIKMLLDDIELDPEDKSSQTLHEQVEHLLDVLNDVRILVNPERVYDSEAKPTELKSLLKRCVDSLAPLTRECGIAVSLATDEGAEQAFDTNPQLLRQLVMNLIRNACFHSKGTLLNLLARTREIDEVNTEILLRFEDNGVGVDKAFQDKLFEPFHRADEDSSGMGLGLSICSTLVEKLNGTIHYEDGVNGGAAFVIRITLQRTAPPTVAVEAQAVAETTDSSQLDWSKLSILFAEDNLTISMLTNKMLSVKGAKVVSGMDGQQALDKFDPESTNLVLTDIFMPNMDGYALTKALRDKGFEGPIIGISAAVLGEETEELIKAGADAVLSKPIKLDELEAELKRLAERIQ